MIIVRLNGGLGNQMFQYAFGRSIAIKSDEQLFLDTFEFYLDSILKRGTPREFELSVFNFKGVVFGLFFSGLVRVLVKCRVLSKFNEKQIFCFDYSMLTKKQGFYSGYWQTEKYFEDIRENILNEFTFKKAEFGKNKVILDKIKATNSVSVHIRRGDYLTCGALSLSDIKNNSYYSDAVRLIKNKIGSPTFFVFSDDLNWVKTNMGSFFGKNIFYVNINSGKNSFEDMRLMSQCKHNIIANSSFSWWGAWLNSNPDKIVIAPKRWAIQDIPTKDLIPKTWIRI